jgi:hypothetical protein
MMVLAPLVLGTQLLLVADRPPNLNIEPGCQAARRTGLNDRSPELCINEENAAKAKLQERWAEFTPAQQARCSNLVRMGGPPSYIELLTCLEMAEQAAKIPDIDVGRTGTTGLSTSAR